MNSECVQNDDIIVHECGESFGCIQDERACRRHKREEEPCEYNFDCESFCCSRQKSATCIPFVESDCKLIDSYFKDGRKKRGWHAIGADDPHDIDSWTDQHDTPSDSCTSSWECDSGQCGGFDQDDRCVVPDCVESLDSSTIRAQYFCLTGDHDAHIDSVTNPLFQPDFDVCPTP